jgi:NitT/TauT family transport system substrate-binding protein
VFRELAGFSVVLEKYRRFVMTEKPARFAVKDATRYAMLGALILVAVLGGYAWRGRTLPAPPAGTPEPVTIAVNSRYAGTGLVFVAHVKGYFANEGLHVTLQPYTSGKVALDVALEGRAELATVADIPIMFAVTKGQPVSIVATIFTGEKDLGIIGRKDKGILTLASLNGKRLGVTLGTSAHFVLDAFLIRQKLSTDDVTLHNLPPEEIADALLKGDVDAVATWEPYLGALRTQLGGNGTIVYSEGIYEVPFTIAGTRDYVVSHPETLKKLLRALVRAERFCKDEPDVARKIMAGALNVSLENLQELWPTFRFNVTLDQSLLLTLEDETRWAIKNQLTGRTDIPNYLHHVYLDALQAVTPAAVTIIH